MTYLPGQTFIVRDGGMGVLANGAVYPVVFGHCSAGTANQLYLSNNQNSLRDPLGPGQAVERRRSELGGIRYDGPHGHQLE